jgi:hypothetical protein
MPIQLYSFVEQLQYQAYHRLNWLGRDSKLVTKLVTIGDANKKAFVEITVSPATIEKG